MPQLPIPLLAIGTAARPPQLPASGTLSQVKNTGGGTFIFSAKLFCVGGLSVKGSTGFSLDAAAASSSFPAFSGLAQIHPGLLELGAGLGGAGPATSASTSTPASTSASTSFAAGAGRLSPASKIVTRSRVGRAPLPWGDRLERPPSASLSAWRSC